MANIKLVFLFSIGSLIMLAGHISQSYILEPAIDNKESGGEQIETSVLAVVPAEPTDTKSIATIEDPIETPLMAPFHVIGHPLLMEGVQCTWCMGMTDFECKAICKKYGLKKYKCDTCTCLCNPPQ